MPVGDVRFREIIWPVSPLGPYIFVHMPDFNSDLHTPFTSPLPHLLKVSSRDQQQY
jgi:hypothetical protein